jgi:hypothetical protein
MEHIIWNLAVCSLLCGGNLGFENDQNQADQILLLASSHEISECSRFFSDYSNFD